MYFFRGSGPNRTTVASPSPPYPSRALPRSQRSSSKEGSFQLAPGSEPSSRYLHSDFRAKRTCPSAARPSSEGEHPPHLAGDAGRNAVPGGAQRISLGEEGGGQRRDGQPAHRLPLERLQRRRQGLLRRAGPGGRDR